MIGTKLGHYEILGRIGSGGMGEVYRARDTRLQREVALKVLPAEVAADPERRSRFEREARAVAALQHPNIVTIHSVEDVDGVRFLTMELVEGETLAEHLGDERPHPEELCGLLLPLVDALSAAHARGIVHRDLKPENVMLTESGQVKLLDFGVAKLAGAAHPDATHTERMTGAGQVVGTLSYMSPEQLRGEVVDARSDLFSLGVLVYELVTGRHPFPGESAAETISSILRDAPPPCSELGGTGMEALGSILERCLEKDPSLRYQDAKEVRDDLARLRDRVHEGASGGAEAGASVASDARERGLAALAAQDWTTAFEHLERADEAGLLSTREREQLGEAAWWAGNFDRCVHLWEQVYAEYVGEGNQERAGHLAVRLAEQHFGRRAQAVASGWLKRAERLLGDADSVAGGYLNRFRTRMCSGQPEKALELSERTVDLGRRFAETNLEALGLMDRGCALIRLGRVAEGKEYLDEAMAFAVGDRLAPDVAGRIYCNMMGICEELADYKRAGEWSEVVTTWCEPHSYSAYPGICRVHRASVVRLRGDWSEAEDLARRAGQQLGEKLVGVAANADYEIGEIELSRGNLPEAEAAFSRAHEKGRDPLPGLALLRLAQGRIDAARRLIHRGLDETEPPLHRARLLPARIEIALARSDPEAARAAIEELDGTGRRFGSAVHVIGARYGRGLLLLSEGDSEGAARELRAAWTEWSELDLPYQAARARLALGEAYLAGGNGEDAILELRAARSAFERLGATPLRQRCEELLSGIEP